MIYGIKKVFACLEGSNAIGKTTVLNRLSNEYHLKISKSVPEWFQSYTLDVRGLSSDQEYKLYEMAHIAAIMEKQDNNVYIYDRSIYSTVIRIFYKSRKTVKETFEFIHNLEIVPELVLIFKCARDICYSRMIERGERNFLDDAFFEFENAVYDLMIKKMDNCYAIDATRNFTLVTNDVYQYILLKFEEII